MLLNNDGSGFNGFSDEEKRNAEKQLREKKLQVENHPMMLQAQEIGAMLKVLLDTSEINSVITNYGSGLQNSVKLIVVKLKTALYSDSYLLCMQHAVVIREHAQYLRLSHHTLRASGYFEEKYLVVFRRELEKFRSLFIDWAGEIRAMKSDCDDDWNLFTK